MEILAGIFDAINSTDSSICQNTLIQAEMTGELTDTKKRGSDRQCPTGVDEPARHNKLIEQRLLIKNESLERDQAREKGGKRQWSIRVIKATRHRHRPRRNELPHAIFGFIPDCSPQCAFQTTFADERIMRCKCLVD